MKILLYGEYSGFFNCLKSGFQQLGHEVFLVSDGNGYKDYPSDFRYDSHRHLPHKIQQLYNWLNLFLHRKYLKGYDVVYMIAPSLHSSHPFFDKIINNYILNHNKYVYLVSTGLYHNGFMFWWKKKNSKYFGYTNDTIMSMDNPDKYVRHHFGNGIVNYENEFMKKVTGIIPIWYEYAEPYRNYPNLKKAICTPIQLDMFEYKPNIVKDGKVVFFHGLSRPCKGGKYILAAFEKLREKHKDDAEFIAAGGLPFEDYMKLIDRTNVIVDDANSYSFCMNAFFSMLKGKIVMGGAEPEGNNELGYQDVPVVNICADVDQICNAIEGIIERKNEIEEWGLKSRKFVEKYHNSLEVAKQYINQYKIDKTKDEQYG